MRSKVTSRPNANMMRPISCSLGLADRAYMSTPISATNGFTKIITTNQLSL